MTEHRPEFGKRRPLPPLTTPPVKRSSHVALLLTGAIAVGGSAFALMPRTPACEPASPGMAAPALLQPDGACVPHGSSSGSGGGSGHGSYFGSFGGNSESRGGSTAVADASAGQVTRGGFGSFARAFGFSRGG
jgi:hypothetical protein